MSIDLLIKPESVLCNARARSKKHCLEILSELLAQPNPEIPNEEIFAKLVERERLGCTGLNKGTAFPHCRIEGLQQSCGALMKLSSAVDFDSPDGESVDLVIGLLVPSDLNEGHYSDIKLITNVLEDERMREALRAANTSNDLYQTLIGSADQPPHSMPSALNA